MWGPAAGQSLRALPRQLESCSPFGGDGRRMSQEGACLPARDWLVLWFSVQVLSAVGESPGQAHRSCLLQTDLALVLSKGLRRVGSGDAREGVFEHAGGAEALCRLVEHHAHEILRLPHDYNIGRLFEEIGEQDGLRRAIAAEHREHALKMYLAGHFLLSARADAGGGGLAALNGATLAEAFGAGDTAPEPGRAERLAQAYSLASLFHGTGYLLFPPESSTREGLEWDDPEVAAALRQVEASVSEAGREVEQRCLDDLGLSYCTGEELAKWRDPPGAREPNRRLLGAWYLHRVGRRVLERCADIQGLRDMQADILRMAVRAVLLHGASTAQVRCDEDPSACMLAVCSSMFEWDPAAPRRSS